MVNVLANACRVRGKWAVFPYWREPEPPAPERKTQRRNRIEDSQELDCDIMFAIRMPGLAAASSWINHIEPQAHLVCRLPTCAVDLHNIRRETLVFDT